MKRSFLQGCFHPPTAENKVLIAYKQYERAKTGAAPSNRITSRSFNIQYARVLLTEGKLDIFEINTGFVFVQLYKCVFLV